MSSSNQAIITESFQIAGVVGEGRPPSPTQSANGLTILNDNMATQIVDGWVNIGWYPQTLAQLNSTAPLRDADVGDVKLVLAGWLAPRYGITIASSPDPSDMTVLGNQIKAAFTRLTKRYLRLTECDLGELSRPQGGPWGGPNYL